MSEKQQTFSRRINQRAQAELDAFNNDPQRLGQAQIDRWWQSRLDEKAEYRRMMKELNPIGLVIWD
jgi:hypothetical protein